MTDNGIRLTPNNTRRDQRSRSHTPFLLRSSCDKEVCLITHNEHNNEVNDHDNDGNSDRISSASRNSNKISQTSSTQYTDVRRSARLKKKNTPFLDLTLDEESRDGSVDNTSDISVSTYSNYSVEIINGGDKRYQQSKENTPVMTTNTDFTTKKSKIDIYKEAGEYWNKYPKTGYTYANENCELMPNMSRRPLTRTPTPSSYSGSYEKIRTSNQFTETVEFEKIISKNYSQKSQQKSSLIRSTTNFIIRIVKTISSTCGYFLKWFYWYFILWAILDTVLLRRRYTLNSGRNLWKNVLGVIFLNLALILGFFLYYQISSISSIGFLPNLVPIHVNEILKKDTITNDNLHYKSEQFFQNQQNTDDLSNQLAQNSQILKAEYQRVQNQLNDLKLNLVKVTEELYSTKILLENSRSCCDKNEYSKVIKDLFDKSINELNRNETEFRENITRALNQFHDEKIKGIIDDFDKRYLNNNQKKLNAQSYLSNNSFEYVNEIIRKYDADKTAVIDYALKAHGGRILDIRCTTPYYTQKKLFNFWSWFDYSDPETILNYRIEPGKCFVFVGFPGIFVIELAQSIIVTEFGLEHVQQEILLRPNSTPRHFTVFGLKNVNDLIGHEFGTYIYDNNGPGLQLFPVQNQKNTKFKIIQLIVTSNYVIGEISEKSLIKRRNENEAVNQCKQIKNDNFLEFI